MKRRDVAAGFFLGVLASASVVLLYTRMINPKVRFVTVKPIALVDHRTNQQLVVPLGAEVYRVNSITGYAVDDYHFDGLLRFSWDPVPSALVQVTGDSPQPNELPVLRSDEVAMNRATSAPSPNSALHRTPTAPPMLPAR